jgi:hypothetical protein
LILFVRKYYGIAFFVWVIIVHGIATVVSPTGFHKMYSGLFAVLRNTYDHTLGLLPFATIYLLLIGFIWAIVLFWRRAYFHKLQHGWNAVIKLMISKTVNVVLLLVGLFYLFWGYNYHRNSLLETQQWTGIDLDSTVLVQELFKITQRLNTYQNTDSTISKQQLSWAIIENEVRQSQTKLLQEWNYPTPGSVRIRPLYPKGSLLRIATAGFYNPFSFEGHVDPGLNPLQWPFTIAHEMGHGYGFTDEGECNFIGLLSCATSDNTYLQYSGWISYWRYLFYDVNSRYPNVAQKCFASRHHNVVKDLQNIRYDSQKYPDIFPWARDMFYDFYLKLHGIEDGLASYNDITRLMISYQNDKHCFMDKR